MSTTSFPETSWLLDRAELLAVYEPDTEQPFPPHCGIRVTPRNKAAEGYREFVLLEEGLGVIVGDIWYREQVTIEHPDRPIIKFHFRLTGSGGIDFDNHGLSRVPEHGGSALYMPTTLTKREIAYAGMHERSVTIACSPAWLAERFVGELDKGPSQLAAYARQEPQEFFLIPITMRSGISQAVGSLLSCELVGELRRVFFLAKAMETLALSLDTLISERAQPEYVEHRISRADFEQLREAHRILQAELGSPLKVSDLAGRVGMNESRLVQLFRRLYGETVFDFSQRARMEFAAKLLEATDRSITEIALEIGYDYPSNFTTAFKRHFGVPPRSVRQGAMGAAPNP